MPDLISPEVECLKLKQAINENYRVAQQFARDAVERAILTGELLCRWKELLTHGKFEVFVEKHFDGSLRTARTYMQAAKGLKALPKRQSSAVLNTEDTMAGLLSRLKKDDSISEKGKPGGAVATSSTHGPVSSDPVTGEAADSSGEDERTEAHGQEAQETGSRPPRSGKDKPGKVDYGKCPNCAGTKWDEVPGEGVSCSKCHHPHGEPVGDRPENVDPAETKRAKAVKTCEAMMREVDDLNLLIPVAGRHKQTIQLCKDILKTVKGWK